MVRWGFAGLAANVIAACSVLPPSQTLDVYRLPETCGANACASVHDGTAQSAPDAASPSGLAHRVTLRVVAPSAGNAISSARIAVIPEGDTLIAYRNARWTDPAPELVGTRLVHALAAQSAFNVVDRDVPVTADWELRSHLGAFQTEYRNGQPVVHVALDVWLIDASSRQIVATRHVDETEAPSAPAVPAVVQAFGRASDRLGDQVATWVSGVIASVPVDHASR
ncbi:ABC-type transport auxiliary lipoprotein family protein [Pararobbsia silviterrae]|nr:ABC-type transport auxiliary lipoprotein family protein [Pararobbsia silviterrae]